uniref:Acyl-CoA dehydrogenase family member 11 n=1 Tax=Nothobranchius furzeri TaxID=105023 RepID=A0A8C6MJ33_NOTFU
MEDKTVSIQPHFNVGNLQRYLSMKLGVSNDDTFTVRQYSVGQSNPTFFIQTTSNSYVLKMRPRDELIPGVQKMETEYLIQKTLFSAGFPVPKAICYCSDVEVIGTEFYVMDHVKVSLFTWVKSSYLAYTLCVCVCVCVCVCFPPCAGVPAASDLISVYCRCRGIPSDSLPQLNFFLALSAFKVLVAQVYNTFIFIIVLQLQHYCPFLNVELRFASPIHQSETICVFFDLRIQEKAKEVGLWNLFLPAVNGLTQVDYAYIAEETGRCFFAPEVFNCQAPDTANMEVLHMFGSEEQKKKWLEPLLRGEIRSCFCMTEPGVPSSDEANMECILHRDEEDYVINSTKWWCSGAGNPKCKVAVVMCRSSRDVSSRHGQHSMILVPMETPGVKLIRPLTVFGQDDAIHGGHFEVHFENVRVPASNIILGEGRGFEIAQRRLGPGRLHHSMRAVGLAEHALELLCQRAASRQTFGKKLHQHEVVAHWIAESRLMIEQTRLLTLYAAHSLDTLGSRAARKQVAMIKVAAARMSCKVVDIAIQYSYARTLRIADGPDEVHLSSIASLELKDQLRKSQAKL